MYKYAFYSLRTQRGELSYRTIVFSSLSWPSQSRCGAVACASQDQEFITLYIFSFSISNVTSIKKNVSATVLDKEQREKFYLFIPI